MALYSDGQLKTEYVEPQIFIDANRVIFELKGHHVAYRSNLRITDLAVTRSARNTALNRLGGILSLVKNARLMDGSTELSSLREANRFLAFKNQAQNHGYAMSVQNAVQGSQIGFEFSGTDRKLSYNGYTTPDAAADTKDNSRTFSINLKDIFPLLNAVEILPTDLFKNLRVEIEFEKLATPALNIFTDANQSASVQRPLLAVDFLDNPMIVKKLEKTLSQVNWLEIEEDSFHVAQEDATQAGTQLKVQNANEKSNGFQNKHIERLLVAKELASVQDAGGFLATNNIRPAYGPLGSYACFRERLQIRLNGKNLLPRAGIEKPMEALSYLVDTWGEQCLYPQANTVDISTAMTEVIRQANEVTAADDYRGAHSYFGLYIGDRVDNLQINYQRTGLQDTGAVVRPATEAMRVHLYAEVKKGMKVMNGKYNIVYL